MPASKRSLVIAVALTLLFPLARSQAYVDLAPTLARVIRESQKIAVAEVDRFSRDKGIIILKKVRDLKGETTAEPIRHQVVKADESAVDGKILDWAEPGRRCVMFVSASVTLVCMGQGWYQVQASSDGWWRPGPARPELPLAYHGTVSRLAGAVEAMLSGRSAVITTVPHGADLEGASFDLALNRASLPGLVKVQRLRANLRMPDLVFAVSANPAYLVGQGPAGEDDIPALREKLRSTDATVRAESAADLGSIGQPAAGAADDVAKLLDDPAVSVRMAAAAALALLNPREAKAIETLVWGLESEDGAVRRQAARAAGMAGPAAAPLAGRLGRLLGDTDEGIRRAALQAIATLGSAAAEAVDSVTQLLDKPDTAIDAADALGRIGPAARPALKRLARMLSADSAAERWAAVRAMSQIGGEDALPAVRFMMRELRTAPEVDGYNMMIYLALLGPVAKDALPWIPTARIKNPTLRQATSWAIEPDKRFPWLAAGPFGPGGFGGALNELDFVRYVYEAYVHELGDRLRPAAAPLAKKIMDGTAGNVPAWAYKVLANFPDDSLAVLCPCLEHKDLVMRERAAVAIGYMGRAAAPAKRQVARAVGNAVNEKEQRLLKWCLREIDDSQGAR
jgi:HEAT repeat protein